MNDDLMLEYLLQMGAMAPEEEKLLRQQAQVDALRKSAAIGPQGQMVGKHYVPPSFTQYGAQLGNAYMANKSQGKLDKKYGEFNKTQGDKLREIQDRIAQRRAIATGETPSSMLPPTGTGSVVKRPYDPNQNYEMNYILF